MAKIIISIEDTAEDRVKVVSEPSFETICMIHASGHPLTSAHGYALRAIRAIQEESRKSSPIQALIPRIGKA